MSSDESSVRHEGLQSSKTSLVLSAAVLTSDDPGTVEVTGIFSWCAEHVQHLESLSPLYRLMEVKD